MNIKLIASGSRPWERWMGYWGLSFLIGETILFDTFSSYHALAKKLQSSKTDISKIKTVIISHNHWDHIGGLWELLDQQHGLDVYLTSKSEESKARILSSGANVIDGDSIKTLSSEIYVMNEILGMFKDKEMPEQSIVIKTAKGLVLIVGCAHPGITTIVKKAKDFFNLPVHAVIGGLHLMNSSNKEIYECANEVKSEGVQMIAPTHCTGWHAERIFKRIFKANYITLREGQTLSFS